MISNIIDSYFLFMGHQPRIHHVCTLAFTLPSIWQTLGPEFMLD